MVVSKHDNDSVLSLTNHIPFQFRFSFMHMQTPTPIIFSTTRSQLLSNLIIRILAFLHFMTYIPFLFPHHLFVRTATSSPVLRLTPRRTVSHTCSDLHSCCLVKQQFSTISQLRATEQINQYRLMNEEKQNISSALPKRQKKIPCFLLQRHFITHMVLQNRLFLLTIFSIFNMVVPPLLFHYFPAYFRNTTLRKSFFFSSNPVVVL